MFQQYAFRSMWLCSYLVLCWTFYQIARFLSTQKSLENDTADVPTWALFTTDLCLVVLFMIQHSVMRSGAYHDFMARWGLQPVARSIYILCSSIVLQVLMNYWQPIPEVHFWLIDLRDAPVLSLFFFISHCVLWTVMLLQIITMYPLRLIGYDQAWRNDASSDVHPSLLKLLDHMPHAGASCFIAILWLQSCMTFDRMILATVLTTYLCCGSAVTTGDYAYAQKCAFTRSKTVYSTTTTTIKSS